MPRIEIIGKALLGLYSRLAGVAAMQADLSQDHCLSMPRGVAGAWYRKRHGLPRLTKSRSGRSLAIFQQCDSLENHCGLEIAVVLNVKGKQ
jgi:hypothetical protein